jgi:subtilisin-like proprotein convertase family protein
VGVLRSWILLALGGVCLSAAQSAGAATTTFSNTAQMFNGTGAGPLAPYPSTITVTGLGTVTDVNARIEDLVHNCHPDIDVLLVGPGGQRTMLWGDSGICEGSPHINSVAFDDEAASSYPGCDFTLGTWRPTDDACVPDFDPFPAPAPPGPYPLSLSVFDGSSASGVWSLFVSDDSSANGASGGVSRGWTLTLTATTPDSTPTCGGVSATLVGSQGNEALAGTPDRDVIVGLGGNDKISGGAANDLVCGGEGADRLRGKGGSDTLIGGPGRDLLVGGKKVDKLFGDSRNSADRPTGGDRCLKAGADRHKGCRVA